MADDLEREQFLSEEIKTSEFVVPNQPVTDEQLVVPTIMSAMPESSQETRDLIDAAHRELDASEGDAARQGRIHLSLGMIIERRLGDARRAMHHYAEANRLVPTNLAGIRALRRGYHSRHNWTMVLALLDEELGQTPDPSAAAGLLLQKARIFEKWLANTDAAVEASRQALQREPGNREALHRLRRIFWRRQEPEQLLEVCRQAAAATRDRRHRAQLLLEVARLEEEHLGDDEAAIEACAAAFTVSPENVGARSALKRLYRKHRRHGDLVDVLLTEGDRAADGRQRAVAYCSAARLCRDQLGQPDRALELLARALELLGQDPGVLEEMAELLQEAGRYSDLADVLRRRIDGLSDDWERVTAHYRLGLVLEERLGQDDEALFHYRRAVAVDPTYVPALQALGRLCQRRGEWKELIALSATEAEVLPDGAARASRLYGLAELCDRQLSDPAQAIEYHRRALASSSRYLPALRALERLHTVRGEWSALADVLEAQLEHCEPGTQRRLLLRLGALAEERLESPERAVRYYERALELADAVPHDGAAGAHAACSEGLDALRRLHARAERWDDVLRTLERQIERCGSEARSLAVCLIHEAAEVCEVRLGDLDGAVERHRQALELQPEHGPSLQALGRIYSRQGNWEAVVALYRAEVEQEELPPGRRSSLLYKMGEIYHDRLHDEPAALRVHEEALEATPRFLPALQAQARLYRQGGDSEQLVLSLSRQADVLADPARRAAILLEVGELYETELDQVDRAVEHYRRAIEQCPGHDGAREALLRVLGGAERWREVAEVCERALPDVGGDQARLELLKIAGEVWEHRLLEPERAARLYEEALALAQDDVESLEALSRIYRRTGSYGRLVEIYELLAHSATDPREVVGYLYEAAHLLDVHLPQRDPAPLLERIVENAASESRALAELNRIYAGRGDLDALLRVCDAQQALEQDDELKAATLAQLAGVREAAGDAAGAAWALGESSALVEDWINTRELRRLRERLNQWEGVAEALEREARLSRDTATAVGCLMQAAALYQMRSDDPAQEVAVLGRVLERDPFHDEAATRLEQLLVQREAWSELVDVLRRRLDVVEAGAQPGGGSAVQAEIELLARMAWIQREHLRQPLEAVATLGRSLQLDPNHLPTLLTLGELHTGLEQWKEAVDIYGRVIQVASDPDVLRMAHVRLGDMWSERLRDHRRAISCYQNVLALAARDSEALGKLFELFYRSRDWDNASDTVSRLIEVESSPQRLVSYHTALADIHEQGFSDPRAAAAQLEQAAAIDAANEEVLSELSRLYTQLGDWEALATAVRSFLAALPAEAEARGVPHRMRLGEILRHRLGRASEALEQYRAVVEIDPTSIEARLAAASVLVEAGRLDEAVAEHRDIQALDALHAESLAQQRKLLSRMGNDELAYALAAVAVCTGQGREAEQSFYRERRSRGVRYPQVPIDGSAFAAVVVHPGEHAAGRRVLALLSEAAHRIRPPRLADWRVGKSDRLPFRSEDPLRGLVREVSQVLDLEREVEVYISPSRVAEVELLLTDPPSIVAGAAVMETYPAMEVRFRLGQLMSYIRNRTWIAYGCGGAKLSLLVHAACRMVEPKALFAGESEAELSEMARLIQRSLSRRGRRAMEEVCNEYLAAREPSFDLWAQAMRHTALHAGLWVVNDLETALSWLGRTDPELSPDEERDEPLVDRLRRSPLASELIQFWMGEEYDALRRASL